MKPTIELLKTKTERTGDGTRTFQFNRSPEHEARVLAHCKRVQREYFDSGLFYKEMHPTEINKKCYTCKETKPIDNFFREHNQKDGYRANCKICHKNILNNIVQRETHKAVGE